MLPKPIGILAPLFLATTLAACLSSNPNPGGGAGTGGAPPPAAPTGTPVVSQPQPGFSGTLVTGVVTFAGKPPPPQSSLYLGLVKSIDDQQPRACIDAARNPLNESGQFYAQVACRPLSGDMLMYVLIIGPEGERNWHRGVLPMPADLGNVRLDVQ